MITHVMPSPASQPDNYVSFMFIFLRFCLKDCPPHDLECALSPYALEYKLVSLPFGIAANQDLIRQVAYTQDGVIYRRTTFLMVDEEQTVPFALRDENLKGVVYTTRPLWKPETYRMRCVFSV
jgi:hemicentin